PLGGFAVREDRQVLRERARAVAHLAEVDASLPVRVELEVLAVPVLVEGLDEVRGGLAEQLRELGAEVALLRLARPRLEVRVRQSLQALHVVLPRPRPEGSSSRCR